MSSNYSLDLQRYNIRGGSKPKGEIKRALTYLRHLRAVQESKNKFVKAYHKRLLIRMSLKYGIRIFPWMSIGPGLYIGHPRDINVNVKATIGRNCNIHRGAVVGIANRGRLMGAPTIGNEVWIGINAVIVGKVTIGDDVLIAPNSYVKCDVPSHSVVFGNPCQIKHKDNATEGYINNKI